MTDTKAIAEDQKLLIASLYRTSFLTVARYVRKNGGSLDEAKDIFQDTLVIYFETSDNISYETSLEQYIFGIARHLWIRRYKEGSLTTSINEDYAGLIDTREPTINQKRLLNFLEQTGKRCMELLTAFYQEKMSMKKLAHSLGFASEHSATVQKFKCMEKLRQTIKDKSFAYEDFFE